MARETILNTNARASISDYAQRIQRIAEQIQYFIRVFPDNVTEYNITVEMQQIEEYSAKLKMEISSNSINIALEEQGYLKKP